MPFTVEPQVRENIQGAHAAPEWAKVLSQVIGYVAPGPGGAALTMNPAQPQPTSDWGKILTMLPMILGGVAAVRGGGAGKEPSSLDALKKMFFERGGVESGEGKAMASAAPGAKAMLSAIASQAQMSPQAASPGEGAPAMRSIPGMAKQILGDWHGVTPQVLQEEFKSRHGLDLSGERLEKLWKVLLDQKVIDPQPGTQMHNYGYHAIHPDGLANLPD